MKLPLRSRCRKLLKKNLIILLNSIKLISPKTKMERDSNMPEFVSMSVTSRMPLILLMPRANHLTKEMAMRSFYLILKKFSMKTLTFTSTLELRSISLPKITRRMFFISKESKLNKMNQLMTLLKNSKILFKDKTCNHKFSTAMLKFTRNKMPGQTSVSKPQLNPKKLMNISKITSSNSEIAFSMLL